MRIKFLKNAQANGPARTIASLLNSNRIVYRYTTVIQLKHCIADITHIVAVIECHATRGPILTS